MDDIIQHCPNLQTLSLCGESFDMQVDLQIDLSGYRANNLPVPLLKYSIYSMQSVDAFIGALSDISNPLAKCVRRFRVRLSGFIGADRVALRSSMVALEELLERNLLLEFFLGHSERNH